MSRHRGIAALGFLLVLLAIGAALALTAAYREVSGVRSTEIYYRAKTILATRRTGSRP